MQLSLLEEPLAVCRLGADAPLPPWARGGALLALIWDVDELTVICPESCLPPGQVAELGWRALKVIGPLDFSLVGVLASLAIPLAQAGISLLALSTYSTDYILVRETNLKGTLEALRSAGHQIVPHSPGGHYA